MGHIAVKCLVLAEVFFVVAMTMNEGIIAFFGSLSGCFLLNAVITMFVYYDAKEKENSDSRGF